MHPASPDGATAKRANSSCDAVHGSYPAGRGISLMWYQATSGAQDARAPRVLPLAESPMGRHAPPDPPALLDVLTDELLMVASDVVAAVATELEPKASGNAQWRLLAWTVAAARGATINLDTALALTVGKRLDRQAQKVRADIATACAAAKAERESARAAAAADATLAGKLAATLAAVDARELKALAAPATEVYIGFHELVGLLPELPPPPPLPPPPAPPSVPTSYNCIRYPWLVEYAHDQAEAGCSADIAPLESAFPPIPPDLVAVLGRDATQALWEATMVRVTDPYNLTDHYHWWCYGLPLSYKLLLAKHADLVEASETVIAQLEAKIDESAAGLQTWGRELTMQVDDLTEENERLSREASEAKAREAALRDVIARIAGSRAQ